MRNGGKKMPDISVLMSVYNEDYEQIMLAVNSILAQSYKDFELIIVHDSPENKDMYTFLQKLALNDSRIILYQNPKNIGLAMSMNMAATIASGKWFARMDADDIAMPERFKIQIECLKNNVYDLVFTNFYEIDERGKLISDNMISYHYKDEEIIRKLCVENIIHHPTVMMTREIFERVGGYRNFPCSQDYDMWLRMVNHGCKFHMINKPLLNYRLRSSGVSANKRLQQKLTLDYARDLMIERLESGEDTYTYDNYVLYVNKITLKN